MIGAPMTDREIDMLASGLFLDEQNTIALFKRASPSVCHIHNVVTGFNPMTLNIDSMQAGSGSGFIWDREGHVRIYSLVFISSLILFLSVHRDEYTY